MYFLIFPHYKARYGKIVTIKRYMKAVTVQDRLHMKNVVLHIISTHETCILKGAQL